MCERIDRVDVKVSRLKRSGDPCVTTWTRINQNQSSFPKEMTSI